MATIQQIDLSTYLGKIDGTSTLPANDWNYVIETLQNKVNSLITNSNEGSAASVNASSFFVNGVLTKPNDSGIVELDITSTTDPEYILEGTLYGSVLIKDTISRDSGSGLSPRVRMNGVTIISSTNKGISFEIPSGATNDFYGDLYIMVNKDTINNIICNQVKDKEDADPGAIFSEHKLYIKGVGYLNCINKGGHGLRGTSIEWCGVKSYIEASHDGVHGGSEVTIIDGSFYINKANDAIGTGTDGIINLWHINISAYNILQNVFDGKGGIKRFLGNEIINTTNTKTDITSNISIIYSQTPVDVFNNYSSYFRKSNTATDGTESTGVIKYTAKLSDNSSGSEMTALYNNTSSMNRYYINPTTSGTLTVSSVDVTIDGGYFTHPINIPTGVQDVTINITGNTYIESTKKCPLIYYGFKDEKNVKIKVEKDCVLMLIQKTTLESTDSDISNDSAYGNIHNANLNDLDVIKSENNINIECKSGSVIYMSSVLSDGLDGSEIKLTDSKGSVLIENCGGRGIKGTTIVVGPNFTASNGTLSYIIDTSSTDYKIFDGNLIVRNNQIGQTYQNGAGRGDDSGGANTYKDYGYADIFARNGKYTKGIFGTTKGELKGIIICGSMSSVTTIDYNNTENIYYKTVPVSGGIINSTGPTKDKYLIYPYMKEPILK